MHNLWSLNWGLLWFLFYRIFPSRGGYINLSSRMHWFSKKKLHHSSIKVRSNNESRLQSEDTCAKKRIPSPLLVSNGSSNHTSDHRENGIRVTFVLSRDCQSDRCRISATRGPWIETCNPKKLLALRCPGVLQFCATFCFQTSCGANSRLLSRTSGLSDGENRLFDDEESFANSSASSNFNFNFLTQVMLFKNLSPKRKKGWRKETNKRARRNRIELKSYKQKFETIVSLEQ